MNYFFLIYRRVLDYMNDYRNTDQTSQRSPSDSAVVKHRGELARDGGDGERAACMTTRWVIDWLHLHALWTDNNIFAAIITWTIFFRSSIKNTFVWHLYSFYVKRVCIPPPIDKMIVYVWSKGKCFLLPTGKSFAAGIYIIQLNGISIEEIRKPAVKFSESVIISYTGR